MQFVIQYLHSETSRNDLDDAKEKTEIISNYELGLSTLSAWKGCMKCILHIAWPLKISQVVCSD